MDDFLEHGSAAKWICVRQFFTLFPWPKQQFQNSINMENSLLSRSESVRKYSSVRLKLNLLPLVKWS